MKIAIQTLKLTNNYGGILQAFALQYYLEKKGFEVIHLDLHTRHDTIYLKFKIFVYKMLYYRFYKVSNKVNSPFLKFISNNINLSNSLYRKTQWEKYIQEQNFDLVLVGSDQVWRLEYINNLLPEFFLDFSSSKTKKASYAASFGVSALDGYPIKKLNTYLDSFSGISVREDSGKIIIKHNFNKESFQHVDPTFLLKEENYIQKFNLNNSVKKSQIFCYVLDKNDAKKKIIDVAKEKLNLPAKLVYGSSVTFINYKDPDILNKPDIDIWLQNFLSSTFIITDSFHGMVFSIIFKKPFLVIANEERGVSRFTSLLKILNLEERLVFMNQEWNVNILSKNIDFERINSLIEREKGRSESYLLNLMK